MNPNAFERNFTQNPMLVEAKRFRRRFLGESRQSTMYRAYLIIAGLIYVLLIAIAIAFRSAFDTTVIVEFQNFLFCLIVPAVTYGAVAGEREKRTWELLVVAPITKAQIIIGKFLSAAIVIVTVGLLILPIAMICYSRQSNTVPGVIFGFLDSVVFGLGFAAVCIFISSRTNRSLGAQVIIYSVLFVWLLVAPMMLSAAAFGQSTDGFMWFHPFVSSAALCDENNPSQLRNMGFLYSPISQALLYLFVIFVSLEGAIFSISAGRTPGGES